MTVIMGNKRYFNYYTFFANSKKYSLLFYWIKIIFLKGVRNPEAAKKTIENSIDSSIIKNSKIYYEQCDTGNMKSVEKFAERVKIITPEVHVLINNGRLILIIKLL